jgi:hypothetical protein
MKQLHASVVGPLPIPNGRPAEHPSSRSTTVYCVVAP